MPPWLLDGSESLEQGYINMDRVSGSFWSVKCPPPTAHRFLLCLCIRPHVSLSSPLGCFRLRRHQGGCHCLRAP